jgi:membrane peptidoglycan carboxypeptidase
MAIELEKKVSKDTILTAYLNEIWLGSTNYGVESAARTYFGKSSKDLDLAESATIAALIQDPKGYLKYPEYLDQRRDTVLDDMFNQGYISKEQRDQAQQEVPKINLAGGVFDAPHFVLNVRDWLDDKFGESAVRTGGYKVFTTLDYSKQKIAEAAVNEFGEKFLKDYGANNEALVALDPKTGQILAEVGSRDFNNKEIDGQYNVVTQGFRQPGSSFKPFVYLDAFEKGYTPDTVLYDVKTDFDLGGQIFNPSNATAKIPIDTNRKLSAGIPLSCTIVDKKSVKKVKLRINPTTTPKGLLRPVVSVVDDRMIGKTGRIHGERIVTIPAKNANAIRSNIGISYCNLAISSSTPPPFQLVTLFP